VIVPYLEVLSDFTDKVLEGELVNEEVCALLDFMESDSSRLEVS